jgi:hypothetical protein
MPPAVIQIDVSRNDIARRLTVPTVGNIVPEHQPVVIIHSGAAAPLMSLLLFNIVRRGSGLRKTTSTQTRFYCLPNSSCSRQDAGIARRQL